MAVKRASSDKKLQGVEATMVVVDEIASVDPEAWLTAATKTWIESRSSPSFNDLLNDHVDRWLPIHDKNLLSTMIKQHPVKQTFMFPLRPDFIGYRTIPEDHAFIANMAFETRPLTDIVDANLSRLVAKTSVDRDEIVITDTASLMFGVTAANALMVPVCIVTTDKEPPLGVPLPIRGGMVYNPSASLIGRWRHFGCIVHGPEMRQRAMDRLTEPGVIL